MGTSKTLVLSCRPLGSDPEESCSTPQSSDMRSAGAGRADFAEPARLTEPFRKMLPSGGGLRSTTSTRLGSVCSLMSDSGRAGLPLGGQARGLEMEGMGLSNRCLPMAVEIVGRASARARARLVQEAPGRAVRK